MADVFFTGEAFSGDVPDPRAGKRRARGQRCVEEEAVDCHPSVEHDLKAKPHWCVRKTLAEWRAHRPCGYELGRS
jgi:hypothetical protein